MNIDYILQNHGIGGYRKRDKTPPPQVTGFTATSGNAQVILTWVNPIDTDFVGLKILRQTGIYPTSVTDGILVYTGANTSYTDTTVINGTTYYYRAFSFDWDSNYNITTIGQEATVTPLANGYSNPITNFVATPGNTQNVLTWTNPTDVNFVKTRIMRQVGNYPTVISDGVQVYDGASLTVTDVGLTNGTPYYYRAFTFNNTNQYCDTVTGQEVAATPLLSYSLYGVKIDTLNSNPATALTYTDDAVGLTPATGNNGAFSYGSWADKFPFNAIKPCMYLNGAVNYYLNPNNYAQKVDGITASDITSGTDGDVMVEFPKIYWKFETIGTDLYVRYSNAKIDATYKCLAHLRGITEKDKCYISAYLGYSLASKLRSLSGKTPTVSQIISAFRTLAEANGAGYTQMAFYQLLMLQVLFIVMFKSRDSQTALGRGYVDGNTAKIATGGTNAKGMFYGETTGKLQNKFCGIEDFYGNIYYWIDGFFSNATRNMLIANQSFNDTGSGYTDYGQGATANLLGYISAVQGGIETGFVAKATAGSATTHYPDFGFLYASCLPVFGGAWANGDTTGAFYLMATHAASASAADIGARAFAL